MRSTATIATATNEVMAKNTKKPAGGDRPTPRVNVGVPEPWHAVLRRLAAKNRQPVIYTIIALAKAEAERQGITDLPLAPWDEDAE